MTLGVVLGSSATARAAGLTLEWDASSEPEVVGYLVSYGASPGNYVAHLNVGSVTRFQVTGLVEGAPYCFAVRARTATGVTSEFSTPVCGNAPGNGGGGGSGGGSGGGGSGSNGQIIVNQGDDLQSALDNAEAGDTIMLQAGATFTGNFVLPRKGNTATAYITLRSSAADNVLPGAGVRMTPEYSARLPKLQSPNGEPVLSTAPGAHHYRLQFLEFLPTEDSDGTIIALGDGTDAQNTLDAVPHHLTLDRVYIRGDAVRGQLRGIALNSASTEIVNSSVSDIKAVGADAQAIAGWNGPGPYLIANNYLEAAGQNLVFGERPPAIPGLVPADVTVQRNHITKQLAWRLQSWTIHNLVTLNNVEGAVIDANVMENTWIAGPSSYALYIATANTTAPLPWSRVEDVQFSNNIVRNVSAGIFVGRVATGSVGDITVRNNLFNKINGARHSGLGTFMMAAGATNVNVDHNTVINDGFFGLVATHLPTSGMVFTNNVIRDRGASILGIGALAGRDTVSKFFPNGEFFGSIYIGKSALLHPVGNYYPSRLSDVRFGSNLRLLASSIFRNGGTDGTDPGVDFDELDRAHK